jgi:hypothetical protein
MTRSKITGRNIEKRIIEILENTNRSLSIKEVREKLNEKFKIKLSPQIVKRFLEHLAEQKKIGRD